MAASTELVVFGPFPIPFDNQGKGTSKRISKDNAREFWEMEGPAKVGGKQGCYVYALKAGKGFMPWYAGKATKTFKQEALHPTKLQHYNDVIFKGRKGTPVLFFVAKPGSQKKIPKNQIDDIETFLIQSAYYKNPLLKNTQKTKVPDWMIRGLVRGGKGKASVSARDLKSTLKL